MRNAAPLVLLFAAKAGACLNDRDTLVREAQSPPGLLTALTGRFERLPPAYYRARVDRIRKVARPTAEELDDLGVALDRLGRSDEAIAVMAHKAAMPHLNREARYRLYANRGTFRAHRALAKRGPVAELNPAIADIAEAIRLKADAHFGREGVQLRVLRWMVAHRTDPKTQSLGITLADEDRTAERDPMKTAIALAGLIELGNAWQSPDVVAAIAALAPAIDEEDASKRQSSKLEVASLRRSAIYAQLRYDELIDKGLHPLDVEAPNAFRQRTIAVPPHERDIIATQWRTERDEAEARTRLRAEYAERRIAAGSHPDTDARFWGAWQEPTASAVRLSERTISHRAERETRTREYNLLSAGAFTLLVLPLVGLVVLLRRRRHAAEARASAT